MKANMITAQCRFCGQVVTFQQDKVFTEKEKQERATLECYCKGGESYRKIVRRKEKALENIALLFGGENEIEEDVGDSVVKLLRAGVDSINANSLEKMTLNLRGGIKAVISQNSKGEISVERTETAKQKLTN